MKAKIVYLSPTLAYANNTPILECITMQTAFPHHKFSLLDVSSLMNMCICVVINLPTRLHVAVCASNGRVAISNNPRDILFLFSMV